MAGGSAQGPGTVADGAPAVARDLYDFLTGDEDARVCRDIPEAACHEQPVNFLVHVASLVCTKVGDGLADAKLTLAWLLGALGAPPAFAAALVPVRESLALAPQLLVAGFIRRAAVRKWFWVGGSVVQGAAVLAMALVALHATGARAAWLVIGLLAVFSLARGVCSVASKDVLGKTISKTRRGTVTGYATSLAGVVTVAFGLYLQTRADAAASPAFFAALLAAAGGLWLLAAAVFGRLGEVPGATSGGGNAIESAIEHLAMLRTDPGLLHFLVTRALLLSTALVAPFYVLLARERTGGDLADLGVLIVASGLAGAISAAVWGRLADRSSRLVLVAAAGVAAALGLTTFVAVGGDWALARSEYFFAGVLFVLGIAHAGVRLGRKTYLVDMATAETRAPYVALSNTIIGLVLLAGSGLAAVVQAFGTRHLVLLLACVSLAAAVSAWRMREVQ